MNDEQNWDDQYDLVVVGSGTGLMGAITAARKGLRTLVVEKERTSEARLPSREAECGCRAIAS